MYRNKAYTGDRELLSGPSIKILVGPDLVEFSLPSPLLQSCSTYFKAALNGQFREAKDREIKLDDEDVNVFKTFVLWLYGGKKLRVADIRDMFNVAEDDCLDVQEETNLVELYAFADKRGIPELANNAITLLAISLSESGLAFPVTVNKAYTVLLGQSRLCNLLVACAISWTLSSLAKESDDELDEFATPYIYAVLREKYTPPKSAKSYNFCKDLHKKPAEFCSMFHSHEASGTCLYQIKHCQRNEPLQEATPGNCTTFSPQPRKDHRS